MKSKLPPETKIAYESQQFLITASDGSSTSAAPDFLIEKPDGSRILVEITLAERDGKDPKQKQRWIMSYFPEIRYVILYRNNLRSIEKQHPNISFWHSKRIRK